MNGSTLDNQSHEGLKKAGKFLKIASFLTLGYVAVMVVAQWVYFIFETPQTDIGSSILTGVLSTFIYLAVGSIVACLFYAISEIIKILMNINDKIEKTS
ncbi:MAG TPA: hypothetical protein VMW66_05200 [Elusimicrobiales bacterium]|nr:hypothetical protein [Elusimicrobiales bacterium]